MRILPSLFTTTDEAAKTTTRTFEPVFQKEETSYLHEAKKVFVVASPVSIRKMSTHGTALAMPGQPAAIFARNDADRRYSPSVVAKRP